MSKGSNRRAAQIPLQEQQDNWERVYGKPTERDNSQYAALVKLREADKHKEG